MEKPKVYFVDFNRVPGISEGTLMRALMQTKVVQCVTTQRDGGEYPLLVVGKPEATIEILKAVAGITAVRAAF